LPWGNQDNSKEIPSTDREKASGETGEWSLTTSPGYGETEGYDGNVGGRVERGRETGRAKKNGNFERRVRGSFLITEKAKKRKRMGSLWVEPM